MKSEEELISYCRHATMELLQMIIKSNDPKWGAYKTFARQEIVKRDRKHRWT